VNISETLNVAIFQTDIAWEDVDSNLLNINNLLNTLTHPADLIVLPEMFATGFTMRPEKFAEHSNGHIVQWMREQAAMRNTPIMGSIAMVDEKKYYNRIIVMQPSGEFASYNKRHLFGFAGEQVHYTAGEHSITLTIKGWRIRPLICYDLRFPVWSRNRSDYDVLIYVANWPARRSFAWTTLLTARAVENMSYCIGVNRTGADGNGIEHSGDSAVFCPKGNKISTIQANRQMVEQVSLSYSELMDFRQKFPALNDADRFEIRI